MKTVNYNLRSLSSRKETSILLVFNLKGKRLRMSSREKIAMEDWDKNQQRAKNINNSKYEKLNNRLDQIESFVHQQLLHNQNSNSNASIHVLKKQIEAFILQLNNSKSESVFWDKYDEFIKYKRKTTSSSKEYEYALKKHLKAVEKKLHISLSFQSLQYAEDGFIEHFRTYLQHEAPNRNGQIGLSTNTIWKQFKNLRVFINWCFDQNFISKFSTKHIQAKNEQIFNIYLTNEELIQLENLVLTVEEKTVLDLFLISCETGLRFSDLCELNEKNIHYEQFEVFPKKTRKNNFVNKLIIPFSPRVKRIIEENNKSIPNYQYSKISRFNKIIKELCKKASIDEPSIHYRIVQGKECIVERKKYELVSSHTGRRTFCTLKFLAGMPTHIIMKFSGHSSEQNFLKYLKLDAELTAKKYKDFFN
jgi:integrase